MNENRSQQEHDGHDRVGKNQYWAFTKYPMGGIGIETDEEQKNKPNERGMILKPVSKGMHGSPLAYFEVVGFTGEEN